MQDGQYNPRLPELKDISNDIALEQVYSPEELAFYSSTIKGRGGEDIAVVDAAVMGRFFVEGDIVEYIECSARTNPALFADGVRDVWVTQRVSRPQRIGSGLILLGIQWLMCVICALCIAMAVSGSDAIQWFIAGSGVVCATVLVALRLRRMIGSGPIVMDEPVVKRWLHDVPTIYSPWVQLDYDAWTSLLDYVSVRDVKDKSVDIRQLRDTMDNVCFGFPFSAWVR